PQQPSHRTPLLRPQTPGIDRRDAGLTDWIVIKNGAVLPDSRPRPSPAPRRAARAREMHRKLNARATSPPPAPIFAHPIRNRRIMVQMHQYPPKLSPRYSNPRPAEKGPIGRISENS